MNKFPAPKALLIPAIGVFFAAVLLAACAGPGTVVEHPVYNELSPLPPGVYPANAVDVRPKAIKEVEPDFPREMGEILEGKATVAFIVRASGQVTNITVVQADDVLYGEAAASAVSKWKFSPAQIKGAPVDCRMTLPFIFDSPYGYDSGPGTESLPSGDRPPDASHPMTIESH